MGDPTLKAQVREQMTAALRVGDKLRLGALRMLAASITNREKEGAALEVQGFRNAHADFYQQIFGWADDMAGAPEADGPPAVTVSAGGKSVTLTGEQFQRLADADVAAAVERAEAEKAADLDSDVDSEQMTHCVPEAESRGLDWRAQSVICLNMSATPLLKVKGSGVKTIGELDEKLGNPCKPTTWPGLAEELGVDAVDIPGLRAAIDEYRQLVESETRPDQAPPADVPMDTFVVYQNRSKKAKPLYSVRASSLSLAREWLDNNTPEGLMYHLRPDMGETAAEGLAVKATIWPTPEIAPETLEGDDQAEPRPVAGSGLSAFPSLDGAVNRGEPLPGSPRRRKGKAEVRA